MEHAAEHAPTIANLLWPAINFTIFVTLLVRALAGPLREFFRARAERLREELNAAERARREAAALRAQLAKDVADLPDACKRLKDDVLATATRERDQMIAQAEQAAERVRRDAILLGEQQVAAARRVLRDEVVTAAIQEATTLVREAMRPADQEQFVHEFIQRAGAAS